MIKILIVSLVMDFEKKGKGEGLYFKGVFGIYVGLFDCNMVGFKGRFFWFLYFLGIVRLLKVFCLKKKKLLRFRRIV